MDMQHVQKYTIFTYASFSEPIGEYKLFSLWKFPQNTSHLQKVVFLLFRALTYYSTFVV